MIPYFSLEKIGPFYTWGVFLALGFLAPFAFVLKRAKEKELNTKVLLNIFIWIVVGSLIGMRLGYVFQFPAIYLLKPLEILKLWDGGLTFYGGLIGGIIGAVFYSKYAKIDKKEFFTIADLVVLYLPLGIIAGRIGCFLINDHQGSLTTLPWGIVWPDGVIRHPVALYLIINGGMIFLILRIFEKKFKKPGSLFLLFLFLYSFTRFFLDFTRSTDPPFSDPSFSGLSVSQWISIIVFLFLVFRKVIDRRLSNR